MPLTLFGVPSRMVVAQVRQNIVIIEFTGCSCQVSGHMQTLYCVLGDFSARDKVVYKR
jgi:predicted alpha/beta-fold hydrolase